MQRVVELLIKSLSLWLTYWLIHPYLMNLLPLKYFNENEGMSSIQYLNELNGVQVTSLKAIQVSKKRWACEKPLFVSTDFTLSVM